MCTGPVPHTSNQTCLTVNMSADPVGMMAGLLVWCKKNRHAHWPVLLQDGCLLDRCHSIIMPIFCNSILHGCWCCAFLSALYVGMVSHYQRCLLVYASLKAMPSGVVPHYQPCQLVRCLILAIPSVVVPHYQPCLLVWYLTISHAF